MNEMNGEESWFVVNKSIIFVVVAGILACVFDYFFIWKPLGLSFSIFVLLIGISVVILTHLLRHHLSRDVVLLFALAMFFAVAVAIRSNALLTVLNVFGTLLLLLLITEVSIRGSIKDFSPIDYLKVFALPIAYLISAVDTVMSVRLPFATPMHTESKQILRGVLITTPVIVLFTVLFAGADPVFHALLSKIFTLDFPHPEHLYIILIAFAFMCGAFAYSFKSESAVRSAASSPVRPLGHIEISILLGSVNALFIIFIGLQATYFFGGIVNIANDTFTYAEYARRGFFELIAISAITLIIILVVEKLIQRSAEHHSQHFRYLSTALAAQVMVLMIFAFNRLSLYESVFGFTTLRLYSHAFIVLLAAVYMFLMYKIHVDTRESTFALGVFSMIVLFVAGMNVLNPDAFIAQKNLERFISTGKIDFEYISRLSFDASSVAVKIFENGDVHERASLGRVLYDRAIAENAPWQSWNVSRVNGRELLQKYTDQFEQYRNYVHEE